MPGGPSPCGAGGGTLPAQKLTSAEGSQAAARQGKPSSIPLAGAAEPAPLAAQSGPPRPGPAGMPRAPRRRPGPQSPAVVAAAAGPCRLSPRPRREREARGGGMGTALGGRRRREWLTLRRQPGAGSGAPRARAAHEGSAPLRSAPRLQHRAATARVPSRQGRAARRPASTQESGSCPLTHSLTDRPTGSRTLPP